MLPCHPTKKQQKNLRVLEHEELPALLRAAEDDGAEIIPLIVSHCRFLKTRQISQFKPINDPNRPLYALPDMERDKLLVELTDAVENAFER